MSAAVLTFSCINWPGQLGMIHNCLVGGGGGHTPSVPYEKMLKTFFNYLLCTYVHFYYYVTLSFCKLVVWTLRPH